MTLVAGRGQNVGLRDFCHIWLCCRRGHPCFTNTCLVLYPVFYAVNAERILNIDLGGGRGVVKLSTKKHDGIILWIPIRTHVLFTILWHVPPRPTFNITIFYVPRDHSWSGPNKPNAYGNDLEAIGMKCCYFWFHSKVKFLTRSLYSESGERQWPFGPLVIWQDPNSHVLLILCYNNMWIFLVYSALSLLLFW